MIFALSDIITWSTISQYYFFIFYWFIKKIQLDILGICNIWRIRNPNTRNFTFNQNHSTRFIERRLDCIFISSCLQEFVNNTDIVPVLSTDHSPLLIPSDKSDKNGNGFWKCINSLVYDEVYVEKMKKTITRINNSDKFM